jgi:hypothetical protein
VVIFTLQPRLFGIDAAFSDQHHCPDLSPIDNTMPAPYWASRSALAKVMFWASTWTHVLLMPLLVIKFNLVLKFIF